MPHAQLQKALSAPSRRAAEARAIYVAGSAFFLGLATAFVLFWPAPQPLFGGQSIGLLASVVATVTSFIAFFIGNVGQYRSIPS